MASAVLCILLITEYFLSSADRGYTVSVQSTGGPGSYHVHRHLVVVEQHSSCPDFAVRTEFTNVFTEELESTSVCLFNNTEVCKWGCGHGVEDTVPGGVFQGLIDVWRCKSH